MDQGPQGLPPNELADRKSNDASTLMQLGIADYNRTNPLILKQIKIKFLYLHCKIVNEDFGKFLRNLVQLKNSIATERIIADHHGCVPKLRGTSYPLAHATSLTDILGLRFRLRLAAGLLHSPKLSNRRKNVITIQFCPFCQRNININDKHLFNTCKPPDELIKITKDLT
jgi:hypothetical protein